MPNWKGIIGRGFRAQEFKDYVATLSFSDWRPEFIVLHNTSAPRLSQWHSHPGEVRMRNLESYYRDEKGWSAGPHLFIADDFIWVFTPLTTSGVHSPSWNSRSWGIEMVGEYDDESFTGGVRENTVDALAVLHTWRGISPDSLRFHKEDPGTTHKHCPGKNVEKASLIASIKARMASGNEGEHVPQDDYLEIGAAASGGRAAASPPLGCFRVVSNDGTLNVRSAPAMSGSVLRVLKSGDTVGGYARNGDWMRIAPSAGEWVGAKYLQSVAGESAAGEEGSIPAGNPSVSGAGGLDAILEAAGISEIARYDWRDRGTAPLGYTKGMAMVYARLFCRLNGGKPDAWVKAMAQKSTGNADRDALAWYEEEFRAQGMDNSADGTATLRHLFVMMMGLGMMESSGKYCEGLYAPDGNTIGETAEAGLFQTSYNARARDKALLEGLFQAYQQNPVSVFLEVFKERKLGGQVTCSAADGTNYGQGDGREYQKLAKTIPEFAAEFTAIAMRSIAGGGPKKGHWGPINKRQVEIVPACDAMFQDVERIVKEKNLCPLFA